MSRRNKIAAHSVVFSLYDTILYFNSLNNYFKHVGASSHPLTHALTHTSTDSEKIALALIFLGGFCTLIANVPAYYVSIKSAETKTSLEENRLVFSPRKNALLMTVTIGSIINKSVAAASSFQALLHDAIPLRGPAREGISYSGFILAMVGNFLAQAAVQMRSMGWRAHIRERLGTGFGVELGTAFYNIPLHVMYWNALNNDALEYGWISERISMSNEIWKNPVKLSLVATGVPLLLVAAGRTQIAYRKLIRERFFGRNQDQKPPSSCQKLTGFINSVQRAGFMFLALVAFFYTLDVDPIAAWMVCLPGIYSLYKANDSVLYPYQPRLSVRRWERSDLSIRLLSPLNLQRDDEEENNGVQQQSYCC